MWLLASEACQVGERWLQDGVKKAALGQLSPKNDVPATMRRLTPQGPHMTTYPAGTATMRRLTPQGLSLFPHGQENTGVRAPGVQAL